MSRLGVILAVLLGGAIYASTVAAQPAASASKPVAKASANAASNPCRECHDPAEVKVHANHGNCESCHRDTAAHLKDPMTASPSKSIPPENCLSCHASGGGHARDANRMNFAFSEHNKAGVQCSDCHGIHNPKVGRQGNVADVRMDNNARLCATCHQDVLARFSMRSHHPVREGGATCTGCHDPHASNQTTLGNKTAQCTACHQSVRGPFAHEHPPVAEDCTTCHDPHGSPNRRLMQVALPMQCLQCHAPPGNRHGQGGTASTTTRISGALLRDCASCHNAIHGSANDMHLRF